MFLCPNITKHLLHRYSDAMFLISHMIKKYQNFAHAWKHISNHPIMANDTISRQKEGISSTNRHMINGLIDPLVRINNTNYNNNLATTSLNYSRTFQLTFAEIYHRLSQLWNGLRKLESCVSTIYNYRDSLCNKTVTPTLINLLALRSVLSNIQKVISKYLGLPSYLTNKYLFSHNKQWTKLHLPS